MQKRDTSGTGLAAPVVRQKRSLPHGSVLSSPEDLAKAVAALTRSCALMRALHRCTGDPPLRSLPAGLEGLARIIVSQQVSAASAAAIWAKTRASFGRLSAKSLATADSSLYRAAGLSRPKERTLRAMADALLSGELRLRELSELDDETIHARLTAIHGIGPWTADIYILFSLGRADAWPSGDLALHLSLARVMKLESHPRREVMEKLAQRWRPWRGVAARLLWSAHALSPDELGDVSPEVITLSRDRK